MMTGTIENCTILFKEMLIKRILKYFKQLIKAKPLIIFGDISEKQKALVYYKTDAFRPFQKHFLSHTNQNEIKLLVQSLRKLNYTVYLLDREAKERHIASLPEQFDLFIYNCAGNSCPLLPCLLSKIKARFNIAYAAGPHPITSIKLVNDRHDNFRKLHPGCNIITRRLVRGSEDELSQRFSLSDAVFYLGNSFSESTYKEKVNVLLCRIYPALPEKLKLRAASNFKLKNPCSFAYIGGNGCICKGLDLVIDAFNRLEDSDAELHIFTVTTESDFLNIYQPIIDNNPNINFHGFKSITSKYFYRILSKVSYVVQPSAAEGTSTSVLAGMRLGLIPIVNDENGIDCEGGKIVINKLTVKSVEQAMRDALALSSYSRELKAKIAYQESWRYSTSGYCNSILKSILSLNKK